MVCSNYSTWFALVMLGGGVCAVGLLVVESTVK